MLLVCYSHIHFSYSALKYPHVWGLSTYVYTGRRVEELCACIWFCVCINKELDDSHHEWLMIVAWLFIMFLDLSFWKVDTFHMSLDLCRYYLDDYVVSFMVFDLCLVGCVGWLVSWFWVHQDAGKHHVLWWSTRCDSLLEEKKDFAVIIFSLVSICFQDWWFSWLVTRCHREVFAAIGERIVDVKEFTRGTCFSVGRLAVFQEQRE